MNSTLLYQTDLEGHRFEFTAYLVNQAIKSGLASGMTLAVPESFRTRYDAVWGAGALDQGGFAAFKWLAPRAPEANPLRRNAGNWKALRKVCGETGATEVFVDEINKYLLPTVRRSSFRLWGILYGPYVRLQNASVFSQWRKRMTVHLFVSRHKPGRIWVLNDPAAAKQLNRIHNRQARFEELPDPVWTNALLKDKECCPVSSTDRTHAVFFGTPRRDKGPFVLLQALARLDNENLKQLSLTFAGQPGADRAEFVSSVEATRKQLPDVEINVVERRLAYGEAAALARNADVFLLPYLRTDRSSGVLGIAARFAKPVIASAGGLLGELVQTNGLGASVPAGDSASLAEAMGSFVKSGTCPGFSEVRARQYAESHSATAFARRILGAMSAAHESGTGEG